MWRGAGRDHTSFYRLFGPPVSSDVQGIQPAGAKLRLLRAEKSDIIEVGSLLERCRSRTTPLFIGFLGRRLALSLGG